MYLLRPCHGNIILYFTPNIVLRLKPEEWSAAPDSCMPAFSFRLNVSSTQTYVGPRLVVATNICYIEQAFSGQHLS